MFRDVEVGDVDRQGDMLGTVGATGTDLCRETLDPPRWCKAPLQDGLLKGREALGNLKHQPTPCLNAPGEVTPIPSWLLALVCPETSL